MRLHLHAAATALLVITLMVVGSLVHGTGSSLACPDWPLCHGEVFPAMRGGVEFEHSHRLIAAAVLASTAVLAWRARRTPGRARSLAWGALGLLLVQAGLGAATVLLRLPPVVSIAHLATSMASLSVLVALAVITWPGRAARSLPLVNARPLVTAAWVAVFGQIVAGGLVRHSGAALACGDLPWCDSAWPAEPLAQLHAVHRAGALAVGLFVVLACVVVARRARLSAAGPVGLAAIAPAALVVLQASLGAAVIATGATLSVVTLHHAVGALLLASLACLEAVVARSAPRVSVARRRAVAAMVHAERAR